MLIGLIGKSNVGKSTFFNAATELNVQTANYPFTTIKPNVGIAYARIKCVCKEFGVQDSPVHAVCVEGNRFIPIRIIDIAGLVPGAHIGKGLGNKFLDDSRQADALIHVVDAAGSTDTEGKLVALGTGDPLYDIKFVEEEFDQWLAAIVGKEWNKFAREESQGLKINNILAERLSGLAIAESDVSIAMDRAGLHNKKLILWTNADILKFCQMIRIVAKPIIIAANKIDLQSAENNIRRIKDSGYNNVIPCASEAEALLRRAAKNGILYYLPGDHSFEINPKVILSDQQKKALNIVDSLIKKYGSTGIQEILNKICFELLRLITVYPVEDEYELTDKKGNVLPDTYMLPYGSTAKDLALKIHGDLGKGFLYAIDIRTKQRIGAEHVLKSNDVIKIISSSSRR